MRAIVRFAAPAVSLLLALASPQARAQAWPQRTVRIIVPLPPGAGADLAARLFAERLSVRWGQSVVVENRQGADGIPAVTGFVSAHDNHTLLLSFGRVITINPLVHDKLPYDPARDLVPISPVTNTFLAIAASRS
jgi:tripartite-type tricarboxylate transporter receptor subunit TctC